jgi:hypothetical protein
MCASDTLSQFYPVTEALGSLSLERGGWRLCLRHRHSSGSWSDCSVAHFSDLTLNELVDVLTSLVDSWPPAGAL